MAPSAERRQDRGISSTCHRASGPRVVPRMRLALPARSIGALRRGWRREPVLGVVVATGVGAERQPFVHKEGVFGTETFPRESGATMGMSHTAPCVCSARPEGCRRATNSDSTYIISVPHLRGGHGSLMDEACANCVRPQRPIGPPACCISWSGWRLEPLAVLAHPRRGLCCYQLV